VSKSSTVDRTSTAEGGSGGVTGRITTFGSGFAAQSYALAGRSGGTSLAHRPSSHAGLALSITIPAPYPFPSHGDCNISTASFTSLSDRRTENPSFSPVSCDYSVARGAITFASFGRSDHSGARGANRPRSQKSWSGNRSLRTSWS